MFSALKSTESVSSKSKSASAKSKSASEESTSSLLNKMLKQLENEKLRHLLLNGIPQSGHFNIDQNDENVKRWVDAQDEDNDCKIDHKITAQFFLDTIRYIPHAELITTFRKIIAKFFKNLNKKPYIILTELEEKSGYFFTLIFLLIVKENKDYYNPIDAITILTKGGYGKTSFKNNDIENAIKSNNGDISFMQINDADYAGGQTQDKVIIPMQNVVLKDNFKDVHTYVLRGYTNEDVIKMFNQYNKKNLFVFGDYLNQDKEDENPFYEKLHYIYGDILPTVEEQLKNYKKIKDEDKEKIKHCYDMILHTINMYFDHKVAAVTSSATINFIDNQKLNAGDAANGTTGIPLIKICDPDPKKINVEENTQQTGMEQYRCPAAWYKYLNYNTGEVDFSKIPRILQLNKAKKTKKKRVNTKAMRRKRRRSKKTKTN